MESYADTGKTRYCPNCDSMQPTEIAKGPRGGLKVERCKACSGWLIKWPVKTYNHVQRLLKSQG